VLFTNPFHPLYGNGPTKTTCEDLGHILAQGTAAWWLESRPFFGNLQRERIWVFWRRVLHTCHHRTQVQTWLGLAGHEPVPAIYGPSGDVKWDGADPTYSVEAAKRGG
jgi:hypothetical protein